jgi:hypothetical protein
MGGKMSEKTNWKEFERLVAAIHIAQSMGGKVTWNDKINGREFDVTIRFNYAFYQYLTVIECKDYKGKIPVEKIEAFITKANDINASKAVVVSSHGYQKGCDKVAERHGVELLILSKEYKETEETITAVLIPVLNIYDVRFIRSDNRKEIALPKSMGGKLLYLMEKIKLELPREVISPRDILRRWQLSKPRDLSDKARKIKIVFPPNTLAIIPQEMERVPIHSMEFVCKIIKARRITEPALDPYLEMQKLSSYVLRTSTGEVKHTAKPDQVELGFDKEIKEGCFYVDPELNFFYYCEKIEGDLISWLLIESYQHGKLIQVRFTQLKEDAINYVEVKDKNEIDRLRVMLNKFMKK